MTRAAVLVMLAALAAGCGHHGDPPTGPAPATTPTSLGTPAAPTAPTGRPSTGPVDGPSAPGPVPGDLPAQPCTGTGLAVSLGAPTTSGQTVSQQMFFQNTGPAPCLLRGFPAVSFVAGNAGTRIGPQALPVGERGAELRLEPRAAAVAPLRVTRAGSYDSGACRPVPVRGLRVAPPGGTGSVFVPRPDTACSAAPDTDPQMQVGTVVAR